MCGRKTRWSLTDIDCLDSRRHVPVQTANLQSYSNLPPFTPPLQCGSPLFQGKAKDSMLELGAVDGPSESPSGWLLDRKQLADTLLDLLLERGSILSRWMLAEYVVSQSVGQRPWRRSCAPSVSFVMSCHSADALAPSTSHVEGGTPRHGPHSLWRSPTLLSDTHTHNNNSTYLSIS